MADESALLGKIGLSRLESKIYLVLLDRSPLTGYRIAQILKKPVANTYKALEGLAKKGLILSSTAEFPRLYSALPVKEYLDRLQEDFLKKRERIEHRLKDRPQPNIYKGFYVLEDFGLVSQRAQSIIEEALETILFDALPGPLELIKGWLIEAAGRGIQVIGKIFDPADLPGCQIVKSKIGPAALTWPVEWLIVVADAKEYLFAFLRSQTQSVIQAVWSPSASMSLLAYNGLLSELILSRLAEAIDQNAPAGQLISILQKTEPLHTHSLSAFENFMKDLSTDRKKGQEKSSNAC